MFHEIVNIKVFEIINSRVNSHFLVVTLQLQSWNTYSQYHNKRFCCTISTVLKEKVMPPLSTANWVETANSFKGKDDFSHCFDAVKGNHKE